MQIKKRRRRGRRRDGDNQSTWEPVTCLELVPVEIIQSILKDHREDSKREELYGYERGENES